MARRDEILALADELLDAGSYREFGPAGAQVLGAREVTKLACGVSASLELFRTAAAAGAQLLLVHHGIWWRNEPLVVDARQRGRLQALFDADLTLAAYHLPLDAHPQLGNAARLAARLGVEVEGSFLGFGVGCRLPTPLPLADLVVRIREATGREPLVFAEGPDPVRRVAIATGSAGHDLISAAREGYDLYLTGEPEEPTLHTARELGISFVAAGHYATERLGVQALAERLAGEFGLDWEFLEIPNPV
jgi:dinuclear metal center YbgI/SA1388 family protein